MQGSKEAGSADLLERLLLKARTVVLFSEGKQFSGWLVLRDDPRRKRHASRSNLEDLLRALLDEHANKRCPRCRQEKRTDQFPRDRTRKGGLNKYCKTCERDRRRAA